MSTSKLPMRTFLFCYLETFAHTCRGLLMLTPSRLKHTTSDLDRWSSQPVPATSSYLLHATVIVPRGSTYDEAFSI